MFTAFLGWLSFMGFLSLIALGIAIVAVVFHPDAEPQDVEIEVDLDDDEWEE